MIYERSYGILWGALTSLLLVTVSLVYPAHGESLGKSIYRRHGVV